MDKRKQQKHTAKAGKSVPGKTSQKTGELTEKQLEAIAGGLARKRNKK